MPGLFWKPHSPQTLSAVPSAATATGIELAGAAGANDVPQERQNWASSLLSVWQTEQSLVIQSASSAFSQGRRTIPQVDGRSQFGRCRGDGQCQLCRDSRNEISGLME